MGLPAVSVKRPVFVAMFFGGFIMLGLISLTRLPVELYQGANPGIVSIIVRARGGLSPYDVEKSITKPVEESVATVSHLVSLYSSSREAESRVTMEFETGTNMKFAALEVREKFSRVIPLLPKEIEKPVIANYDDQDAAIFNFAFTSKTMSPEDVRKLVELELSPIVSRLDGVASVEVYGGRERKILVEMDRDKMFAYNISIERVMDIIGQANINLLAGDVNVGKYEFAIRTMGAFQSVDEIGELGIQATRQGSIIPLKEIATVKDAYSEAEDAARLNLEQMVTVYVKKTSMARTIPVVKVLRLALNEFMVKHKEDLNLIVVSDKAESISKAIKDVRDSLLIGICLTVAMIYLALRQWILAVIVSMAIPCSVIITFFFMDMMGISLNVMSLSGLALSIGIMVDSAVVILENTFVKLEKGYDDHHAILEGSEEVWVPLMASLITTLIVFLPILFIDKKIQQTYAGFAFTVSISLIVSFFVALMLIPMLLIQWAEGKIKVQTPEEAAAGFLGKMQKGYARVMKWNLKMRYPVVFAVFILLGFAMFKIATKPIDWPTTMQENEFQIIVFPLAGAKVEANDDCVKKIEAIISKIPDIEMFSSTVRKDQVNVFCRLKPKDKRIYSKEEIMKLLDEKGNEAIKQVHDDYSMIVDEGAGSGEQKKMIINIYGVENEQLQKLAQEFAQKLGQIPGFANIVMTDLRKRPEYSLVVDKGRAALYGLTVHAIADAMHAQVRGMRPTKFHEITKGEEIEVITRLQAIYRQKIEDLKFIHVSTDAGNQVPIGEFANFYPADGPQTIDRKDKHRYVFVKGDAKRPLEELGLEVRKALKDVKMPDDYYWRFGGGYDELISGKSQMNVALLLTVFLVYMVLACMFESFFLPLLIMISVPMASIGIWLALTITKKPLSQPVFIGMVLLAGYVVNAAIIMLDHMNHLRAKGMPEREVLVQAGMDRLRPIMMTTASTGCGFLPMALSIGSSSDLWSPLAVTVIGGLLSSTFLTLFILPNFILISSELGEKLGRLIKAIKNRIRHFVEQFRYQLSQTNR